MDYVVYDRSAALNAIRRAAEGQSIFAAEYNAIVALLGGIRDDLLSNLRPQVRVPSPVGEQRMGPVVGWTNGEAKMTVADDRIIAAAALGYSLRRLRSGYRILRTTVANVPIGESWVTRVALVAEPATALISPTAVPSYTPVEVDASAARDAEAAYQFAYELMGNSSSTLPFHSDSVRTRAAWMAREYDTNSGRAEVAAYAIITAAMLSALWALGAFRRAPKEDDGSEDQTESEPPQKPRKKPQQGIPGVVSHPYGGPVARPTWF